MASIRRTLSPANQDRSSSVYQNGSSLPTVTNYANKSSSSRFSVGLRRLLSLAGVSSRRSSWRKPFYRCLVFFIVGFLLGILHFDSIDDNVVRTHDFSFENVNRDNVNMNSFRKNDVVLKAAEEKSVGTKFEHSNPKKNDVVLKAEEEKTINVKSPEMKEKFEENDVVLKAEEEKTVDVKLSERRENFEYEKPRKLLIVVTPTYNRVLQAYYLNRLGQVLRLVNSPVLWIVVEMNAQSMETASILRNAGVMYRHLVCRKNSTSVKDRGVHQRNTALEHIELHRLDGVVYFADDDNVYSLELFERIRDISRFGTWPVAMLAQSKNKAILEGPVCNGSQVIGWHTNEKSMRLRRFHVDMSGFAFNSTILWDPKRWKRPFFYPVRQLDTVKEGFQETTFIEQVVAEESQMEGIPHGCGKIMNWHLHLDARGVDYPRGWILQKNLDTVFSID